MSKNEHGLEFGMSSDPDRDNDMDVRLEPPNETEDEMEMKHQCTACGKENTILPPWGHKFMKKSQVEREFDRLDEAFRSDIALAFRESYAAKLRRRSCPLPT